MNSIPNHLLTPKNGIREAVRKAVPGSYKNQVTPLTNPRAIVEAGNEAMRNMGINEGNLPKSIAGTVKKGLTKTQKTIAIVAGAVLATAGALFGIKKAKENTEAQK